VHLKGVHWNLPNSPDFGSPFSDVGSTDSQTTTGSLQFINAQLLSHGFIYGQGLSLDGLDRPECDKVVKCLLGMLSQRVVSSETCILSFQQHPLNVVLGGYVSHGGADNKVQNTILRL
jgi:hypothetical protein